MEQASNIDHIRVLKIRTSQVRVFCITTCMCMYAIFAYGCIYTLYYLLVYKQKGKKMMETNPN